MTSWIPTRNSKKSKCFIQCRLGTRKPFFPSLQMYRICTELQGKSEMLRLVRTSAISVKSGTCRIAGDNMLNGDTPYTKELPDNYAMSDNYHQRWVVLDWTALCWDLVMRSGSAMRTVIPLCPPTLRCKTVTVDSATMARQPENLGVEPNLQQLLGYVAAWCRSHRYISRLAHSSDQAELRSGSLLPVE